MPELCRPLLIMCLCSSPPCNDLQMGVEFLGLRALAELHGELLVLHVDTCVSSLWLCTRPAICATMKHFWVRSPTCLSKTRRMVSAMVKFRIYVGEPYLRGSKQLTTQTNHPLGHEYSILLLMEVVIIFIVQTFGDLALLSESQLWGV